MMKRWIAVFFVAASILWAVNGLADVELVARGWEAEDAKAFSALAATYKRAATGVTVSYEAVARDGYEGAVESSIRGGSGADLLYVPCYEQGLALWNAGLLLDLKDAPEAEANYAAGSRQAWSSAEGNLFAVPLYGAVHAVYCNMDLLRELGLNPPATWDEFMAVCEALRAAGDVPIANSAQDGRALFEDGFLAMLPNYVGGAEGRSTYQSGGQPMNARAMVSALTDFAQLCEYLYNGETSGDSAMARFADGKCAMYMGTSANMEALDGADFEWDLFAVPAREAEDTVVCFQPEAGIAVNPRGANVRQAADFARWLAGPDAMNLLAGALPEGHLPMIDAPLKLDGPHADALLALVDGRETDVPFARPGLPMYDIMMGEALKIAAGQQTPRGAADAMMAGFVPLD